MGAVPLPPNVFTSHHRQSRAAFLPHPCVCQHVAHFATYNVRRQGFESRAGRSRSREREISLQKVPFLPKSLRASSHGFQGQDVQGGTHTSGTEAQSPRGGEFTPALPHSRVPHRPGFLGPEGFPGCGTFILKLGCAGQSWMVGQPSRSPWT